MDTASLYRKWVKRILDLLFGLVLLSVFLPVMAVVTLLLFIFQHRKVFFIQERPGLYGKPFRIIKFCTMKDLKDKDGILLPDTQRMTRIGRWLRRTSIDELPQLFNVLKGDMSMIGPRPLLMEYLPLYTPEQNKRHEVRPGITGLAQIKGGNGLSWEQRFEYDTYYATHISFGLDCRIFIQTIVLLSGLRKDSFSGVPAEKFIGTKSE